MEENLREAERRIQEARSTRAETLDLGDLALSELPASLGDLPNLRALYLGQYRPGEDGKPHRDGTRPLPHLSDISPLAGLQDLQILDLAGCHRVTDLTPIAGLQTLRCLDISDTGVTDLAPIARLQALQTLRLIGCESVTELAPIAELQALQTLNLIGCHGVTELAPISGLQDLQNLKLWGTGVMDLTPITGLQNLQHLNLLGMDVTNLAPIAGLQDLQNLNLTNTDVTDLAPIAGLQALQSLYLANTRMTDLAPIAGLQALQTLNLYHSGPPIPNRHLRAFVDHPRLAKLFADKGAGVPREVLSHELDNCLPRLRAYFSELDVGAETENEVKVILLGNGRVGKTQLCRRFRGEPFDDTVASTHGVQIWREELRLQAGGKEQAFQVSWWDFGGQDIYHGTHALFLRSRAVFLILWTPELENRQEFEENGIPLRNQPLAYWLDYVRSLAGKDSPVIVVQSRCDRFGDQRPDPPVPEGLGFVQRCFYSAKTDTGRNTLESQLHNAIGYLLERNGALEIGRGRAKVRRQLYAWRAADQQRPPERRKRRTISVDQFRALCKKVGGSVSWEHALDYFHQTGVVFYDRDLFASRIVLDQDWALDAVYTVFHRGRAVHLLRDSGTFTREDLALIAWQSHSPEEQRLFLGLMESCGVCFKCGTTRHGEQLYAAPDLLPPIETLKRKAPLRDWKDEPGAPTLRLEYRFFHPAIIRGLMRQIGWQAGDLAEYWKYGLWFQDGKRGAQILVQFMDTKTAEAPGAGALELKAQGGDAVGLLREIRRVIRQQRIGEEPEELLTLNGTTVARSSLSTQTNDGRALDTGGTWVAARAFAAFFEGREHQPEKAPAGEKRDEIDIAPRALGPGEKRREVFISYAWGDDKTSEGKIREQVATNLYAALEKEGSLQPVWDRGEIRNGDLISSFIKRLTNADLVVAVISDRYLRSPYCMHEIYKLWQKAQGESDQMAERVIPIVLPEVRIGTLRERSPYLLHWKDEAQEAAALSQQLGLQLSRKSWDRARLVGEFAHHIDDILDFLQDVLMPRQLEAHLDHGFPAVLDALRRRIGG